jgi:pyruvate,water dikinase
MARSYIRCFEDIGKGDVASVGGKNASLGEMVRNLGRHGIKVPPGLAVTANGYRHFIASNDLDGSLLRNSLPGKQAASIAEVGSAIRSAIEGEWLRSCGS